MNYKTLYHILNRRRKTEFECINKTMQSAVELYTTIITVDRYKKDKDIRNLCNNVCSDLEKLIDEFRLTDISVEGYYMDEKLHKTIIYPFKR